MEEEKEDLLRTGLSIIPDDDAAMVVVVVAAADALASPVVVFGPLDLEEEESP